MQQKNNYPIQGFCARINNTIKKLPIKVLLIFHFPAEHNSQRSTEKQVEMFENYCLIR